MYAESCAEMPDIGEVYVSFDNLTPLVSTHTASHQTLWAPNMSGPLPISAGIQGYKLQKKYTCLGKSMS